MSITRPNIPVPDELADVRARIKELEAREIELRQLLLANPDIRTGASWLAEIKTVSQSRTDLNELRANYPDVVREFTFSVEMTRVVLSGIMDDGEIVNARRLRQTTEGKPK